MEGQVEVFCGSGRGKTAAALGICTRAASAGKQAIIVRFLKGKDSAQLEYLKRLEPEIKFFTFSNKATLGLLDSIILINSKNNSPRPFLSSNPCLYPAIENA